MRGIVLTVDRRNGRGLLRAEDGRRYGFDLADWRDDSQPAKGDEVDFELHGGAPRELLLLNAAETREGASQLAALAQHIRERPILVWAGALFLASLLPAYGFAGRPGSLFAIQAHISSLAGEIDRLWAAAGTGPDIAARVGIAKLLLAILPVTLAAPLLACLVFWRTLNEQDDRPLARITGLAAAFLTAGLPLLYGFCAWLLLSGELGRGAREILAGGPFAVAGLGMLRFIDIGTVAVSVSGFMLWRAASVGRLLPLPRAAVPRNDDPAAFAPSQVARRAPGDAEGEGDDPIPAQFRRNARARDAARRAGGAVPSSPSHSAEPGEDEPQSAVTELLPAHMLPPEPRMPGSIRLDSISWPPPDSGAEEFGEAAPEPVGHAALLPDLEPEKPVAPLPPERPRREEPAGRPAANMRNAAEGAPPSQQRDRQVERAGRAAPPSPTRPQPSSMAQSRPEPSIRRAPPPQAISDSPPVRERPLSSRAPSPPASRPTSPPRQPLVPAAEPASAADPAPPAAADAVAPPAVSEGNESVQRLYERLRAERLLRLAQGSDDS